MLSIIVENGGHGGESAAPIAQAILQKYFVSRGVIEEPELEEEESDLEKPELAKLEVESRAVLAE